MKISSQIIDKEQPVNIRIRSAPLQSPNSDSGFGAELALVEVYAVRVLLFVTVMKYFRRVGRLVAMMLLAVLVERDPCLDLSLQLFTVCLSVCLSVSLMVHVCPPRRLCFTRRFSVCLSACWQLYVKTTYRVFMKI